MGWFIRSVVGVEVKLLVSLRVVLHRDTKPSHCEGQVACVYNLTNNRPWSRHTHQAASVRFPTHGAGTPAFIWEKPLLCVRDGLAIRRGGTRCCL